MLPGDCMRRSPDIADLPKAKHIQRMEQLFEKVAYLSVALDFFVAAATFLVLRNVTYSGTLLHIGDYLILLETMIAALLFVTLMAMKHYTRVMDRFVIMNLRRFGRAGRSAARMLRRLGGLWR